MEDVRPESFHKLYPVCYSALDPGQRNIVTDVYAGLSDGGCIVSAISGISELPLFFTDLLNLENEFNRLAGSEHVIDRDVSETTVNPTLKLIELSRKGLVPFFGCDESPEPEHAPEIVLLWVNPETGAVNIRAASDEDLLVLKLVAERISSVEAAKAGGLPVGAVDKAVKRAADRGLLLTPPSRIARERAHFPEGACMLDVTSASSFTLQWHITQACDLQCKHCYDRSSRNRMDMRTAVKVLDELREFCLDRHVEGHVTFSGGNPLLYPRFELLYKEASDRGLSLSILGNPTDGRTLARLVEIKRPSFFQVSLEGLEPHNDAVRGSGHFRRTIEFLKILKEQNVYSMVMLTLTRDNMKQVLPLARLLDGLVDSFNFNRLSLVGEGANLALPKPEEYKEFLEKYLAASDENNYIKVKDNLFNILLHDSQRELFDGCTGFGCGAAFNFISVLSDGEAHACRKFPSPIGNVFRDGIAGVYDSARAARYRSRPEGCKDCGISPVCGGCFAIAHSFGYNVFKQKDPFCFMGATVTKGEL
jgi:selenobiotic family peptide radical SAM maturase